MDKFDEYFHSSKSCLMPHEYETAKIGWKACKREILNTIKSKTKNPNFTLADIWEAMEKIEKL